ncbi:ribonuclease catalytic domain-containing protein [Acaryochloris sp. CCMEE 5410]|uniref:ribonuclease catalytic domain-containing protein n=2 Tax=Acaryochloris TaxID=155977 RepID=UPI0002485173|nr:ribonuclease catalytic domain-containing protein [Acaryochloris sp. CCMEE 5410]KAI9129245.1 RNB domain-containing ribonuclease [Acaryochloris sp. CCMEE 5410]
MPSSTVEKLSQLRSQLQQCSNPTAAKVLKSAIKKLEAQLDPSQPKTTASKIAQRKAALRHSQKQAKQKALQQERTTLKPPSLIKLESKSEGVSQDKKPITLDQEKPIEQAKASVQDTKSKLPTQDSPPAKTETTHKSKNRFPPQAFAAAKRIVLTDELWQRPQVQGITIDGPTSRDLDDAIWIEATESGAVLSVHIADVSEIVEIGSSLDEVAIERTTTRYFSKGNAPMLPRPLSEDKLSLLENQKRPTLTIQVTLDANAQMIDTEIFESWLTSQKRFTYAEASQPVSHSAFQETLEMAHQWALHLYRNRLTSGAIGATQTAQGQWLTEEGSLSRSEHHRSHILIQEFMILANRAVAQWLADQDIPALYRNHTARAIAPDRETMYQTLLTLGSSAAIRQRLYSWMNRAEYAPTLIGHFALNLPAYCHFTSPIRRLADLINHRIVKAVLKQQEVPYTVLELEQLGQHIAQVRRKDEEETSEYFKAEHQKVYQDQLQAPEELGHLSSKEFSRLVKYATENQDIERLRSELVTRLESEKLTVQDLYLLVFQRSDRELQHQVVQHLANHVQEAASVISIASSQEKDWEAFEYIEVGDSTPFTVWLEVKQSGESFTTVHPAVHSRKQDARHQACLLWLEAYLQNSLVTPGEREQPPLPEPQPVSSASSKNAEPLSKAMHTALMKPLSGGQNFVGMLVDVCQRLRWENPEYEMDSSDDWFICKCELDVLGERLEGSGVAKKKKLAKSLAAKEVLEQVRELAPQHWEEWFPGVAFSQPKNLTNQED